MTDYQQMAKDAAKRRGQLEGALSQAKASVASCEAELAVLDQILAALKGAGKATGAAPKRRGRPVGSGKRAGKARKKRGTWKQGRPGRPPQWFVDQQKAAGAGKKPGRKKRRGRRPGRRAAAKAAAAAPEAASPAPTL